jgi:thiamine pyrophosphokinase
MPNSALLICDGLLPEKKWIKSRILQHEIAVACDGAANVLLTYALFPTVIIGDLDSFNRQLLSEQHTSSVLVVHDSDQETNDLEKALEYVLKKGFESCEIIGALGKRLDHTLKNLSVLQRFYPRFSTVYILDEWGIHFFGKSVTEIYAPVGTPLSLVPFNGRVTGISTEGLCYGLKQEWLENGKRDGTSNELLATNAIIKKQQGELLISVHKQTEQEFSFQVESDSLSLVLNS